MSENYSVEQILEASFAREVQNINKYTIEALKIRSFIVAQ